MSLVLALNGIDEVVLAADSAGYTDHPGGMYRRKCRKLLKVNKSRWVVGIAGSDESLSLIDANSAGLASVSTPRRPPATTLTNYGMNTARVFHWICISCWPGLIFGDHSFTSGHLIDQSPGGPNFLDWPVNLLPVTMRQSGLPFMATVGQNASLCE